MQMEFLKTDDDLAQHDLTWEDVRDAVECRFIGSLCTLIQRTLKMKKTAKSQGTCVLMYVYVRVYVCVYENHIVEVI